MDISSAQLPLDTDERSQLPPSVTDAAREERLRRRRERERARRASERPEEKEARYVNKHRRRKQSVAGGGGTICLASLCGSTKAAKQPIIFSARSVENFYA